MHLLHVISDLDHGGAQTQLRLLAVAAIERGEQVTVVSLKRPGPVGVLLREAGARVVWIGRRFRVDPIAAIQLVRLVRRTRPEVIQSWDAASASFCRVVRRVTGAPWIETRRTLDEAVSPRGDLVVAADEAIAASLGDRATTIPNTFDPAIAPADTARKKAARQWLQAGGVDVSEASPVIAVVTRIDRRQAINELVWAADLVRVVCPGLRLLVVGEGNALLACRRFADKAVEPGLVVWLEACDDPAPIYAAADVVWCGAGKSAAPTPAIEALAAGKPLVLADGPGRELLVPDTTEVGAAGLRPRWNDRAGWARTTKRLLQDAAIAERIGSNNARRVREHHQASEVTRRYKEALLGLAPEAAASKT